MIFILGSGMKQIIKDSAETSEIYFLLRKSMKVIAYADEQASAGDLS